MIMKHKFWILMQLLWIKLSFFVNKNNDKAVKRYLSVLYKLKTGNELNIDRPKTYTEKIQAYKFFLRGRGFEKYVNKIDVRDWIKKIIGGDYLIPVLGVYERSDEMNVDSLPSKFIIKTNHGAGMNYIVYDKEKEDWTKLKKKIDKWLSTDYSRRNGFEFQYEKIKPAVYIEPLISDCGGMLHEFKFLCFDGKPYFCMLDVDRFSGHKRNIYNTEWDLQEWNIGGFENTDDKIPKPKNLLQMIEIAKKLSSGFSHVRVDLYNVDGKIYFSEMTFTFGSGYSVPRPSYANEFLGSLWHLI